MITEHLNHFNTDILILVVSGKKASQSVSLGWRSAAGKRELLPEEEEGVQRKQLPQLGVE